MSRALSQPYESTATGSCAVEKSRSTSSDPPTACLGPRLARAARAARDDAPVPLGHHLAVAQLEQPRRVDDVGVSEERFKLFATELRGATARLRPSRGAVVKAFLSMQCP